MESPLPDLRALVLTLDIRATATDNTDNNSTDIIPGMAARA